MSEVNSRLFGQALRRWRYQRRLARSLDRADVSVGRLRISDAGCGADHTLGLRKRGRILNVAINCRAVLSSIELADVLRQRSPAIIDPFMRAGVSAALGNVSDGEESGPATISFSAADPDAILVPDSIFYRSRGYASYRALANGWQTSWAARKEDIVWRGSSTGRGQIASAEMDEDDDRLIQRTRMCLMLRGIPGVDARLINVAQSMRPLRDKRRLEQAGIFGDHLDPRTWLIRKFAIDIDGNTNAWSNLFTRLLAGCCVIKVGSPIGYRQWYYPELRAWQHFVPVKAGLSDLREKIDWCRTHYPQCAEIAAAGRDFALGRDFAREMNAAVETLNRRLCPG